LLNFGDRSGTGVFNATWPYIITNHHEIFLGQLEKKISFENSGGNELNDQENHYYSYALNSRQAIRECISQKSHFS
jgi:Mor family transcriptional regulator